MFKNTTVKKSLILLVAALMCVAVFLSACSGNKFKPVSDPGINGKVDSNGGAVVRYGDWLYYVNGYQSSVNAENTYVDTSAAPRVGSVARIELKNLKKVLEVNDNDELTSSEKSDEIAEKVREYAEIVVPKIYYSGNTTTPTLNGIYILDNRLYILTPNDELTAGGNSQTTQSVLMSFKLDGSDPIRHYTFSSNSAQIWLYKDVNDGKVMATYYVNTTLGVLDIASGVDTVIKNKDGDADTISTVNFNENGNCVFFIDGEGAICKLICGKTEKDVIVANPIPEGKETSNITYTITAANNGYVYYTKADSDDTTVDNKVLYYACFAVTDDEENVACNTVELPAGWMAWEENKLVIVNKTDDGYYGLNILNSANGETQIQVLQPGWNKNSITINKIDGDLLYYTVNNVTYIKDLAAFVGASATGDASDLGTPYAASWSMSVSVGWSTPDIVVVKDGDEETTYMFTLGSGSISVYKFDAEKKTNSDPAQLTLTAKSAN